MLKTIFTVASTILLASFQTAYAADKTSSCDEMRLSCQQDILDQVQGMTAASLDQHTKSCWDNYYLCTGEPAQHAAADQQEQQPVQHASAEAPASKPVTHIQPEHNIKAGEITAALHQNIGEHEQAPAQKKQQTAALEQPAEQENPPAVKARQVTASLNPKEAAQEEIADQAPAPSMKDIKHFVLHTGGAAGYIEDCYIDGSDVTCKGNFVKQPLALKSYDSTFIGKISGSVIKGKAISIKIAAGTGTEARCESTEENNWPMTIKLGANNQAEVETGAAKSLTTITGTQGCSGTTENSFPANKTTMKWRAAV